MKTSRKKSTLFMAALYSVLLLMILALVGGSIGYRNAGPKAESAVHLTEMTVSVDGSAPETVVLPHSFRHLEGHTPVTLTAEIPLRTEDVIYIKSVYAPAKIYVNDVLCYEFGLPENRPSFMTDPATEVHMVETAAAGGAVRLRMEFLSPLSRSTLTVHPPIIGSAKEIILERFHLLGIPFTLSLSQIIYGFSMIFISVCILFVDKKGIAFLWLGLTSLTTGLWAFGENNFTGIIFKNATFLYLISFLGFFTFIIPLLRFTRSVVEFEHPGPVRFMEGCMAVFITAAMLLQFTGKIAFSKSMYFFHAVLPLVLLVLTVMTAVESIRWKNSSARRYILPIGILTLTALLELANYKFTVTFVFSSLFQMGILIYLLAMGVTAALSVKDSLGLKEKEKDLEFERGLITIQQQEQSSSNRLLLEKEETLRRQRHDLRHQIAFLRDLAENDREKLIPYLDSLMDSIPSRQERFCENPAVNAIVSHYAALCEEKGIEFSAKLAVPLQNEHISDSSLCAVFGNLLENCVEACLRMQQGEKFIRINSTVHLGILTVTTDNSFDGSVSAEGEKFLSSKRSGFGIGTASIRSIARQAGGDADFRIKDGVFFASVYVTL